MEQLHDINTFVKMITDKGYNGAFQTSSAYPDTLGKSIRRFLDACEKGTDYPLNENKLMLRTFLEWNGEDRPYTDCVMWVKWKDNSFDVESMEVERKNRYSVSMKKMAFNNLTTTTMPSVQEVLSQIIEQNRNRITPPKRRIGI